MPKITTRTELNFLSELYVEDAPEATLLAEYPSSNSNETVFRNNTRYIIHDPFPPPRTELLKTLGPHHLMCGWGNLIPVTSQVAPPLVLVEHWRALFGDAGCPSWRAWDDETKQSNTTPRQYITLFPHQSIPAEFQALDPETNYAIHSKEVIGKIDCRQADILESVRPPCIVKLSHGYAGLGNYLIENDRDEKKMRVTLAAHWPNATLVINSIIEDIVGDYGVQFYLRRDGSIVWLGFTEQIFSDTKRWCGGRFSSELQSELFEDMTGHIAAVGKHLHSVGYFGLIGIDLLKNNSNDFFLVDVNPRLTGITPFLMTSRIFSRDLGLNEGIYHASVHFNGSLEQLLSSAMRYNVGDACRVVVLSAYEEPDDDDQPNTLCHLSITTNCQLRNEDVLGNVLSV